MITAIGRPRGQFMTVEISKIRMQAIAKRLEDSFVRIDINSKGVFKALKDEDWTRVRPKLPAFRQALQEMHLALDELEHLDLILQFEE